MGLHEISHQTPITIAGGAGAKALGVSMRTYATGKKPNEQFFTNYNTSKDHDIPLDARRKIMAWLTLIAPSKSWDSLSTEEKQDYYNKYKNGELQEEYQTKINKLKDNFNGCKTENDVIDRMLEEIISRQDPNFKSLSPEERAKIIQDKEFELLCQISPQAAKVTPDKLDKIYRGQKDNLKEIIFAGYIGVVDIDNKEQIAALKKNNFLQTRTLGKLSYSILPKNKKFISQVPQNGDIEKNNLKKLRTELREKAIAAGANPDEISEDALLYDYLKEKINNGEKLTDIEQKEFNVLDEQYKKLGEVTGRSTDSDIDACQSYVRTCGEFSEEEDVCFETMNEEQKARLKAKFIEDVNLFQEPDEQIDFLNNVVLHNCATRAELQFFSDIINELGLAPEVLEQLCERNELEENPEDAQANGKEEIANKMIEVCENIENLPEEIKEEVKKDIRKALPNQGSKNTKGLNSQAAAIYTSLVVDPTKSKGQNQKDLYNSMPNAVEHQLLTRNQANALTVNILPELDEENVLDVGKTYYKSGYVDDSMGQAIARIRQKNVKAADGLVDLMANDKDLPEGRKAVIFRDLIDFAGDDETRNRYQAIADEHNIDYGSVEPHDVRTGTTTTNSSGENVASSTYNEINGVSNSLSQEGANTPNIFQSTWNSLTNSIDTFLEELTFPNNNIPTNKRYTFDEAKSILEQAGGMQKLPKVFAKSTIGVKRDLISYVYEHDKDALIPLMKKFGGRTIHSLAKGDDKKNFIENAMETIALNDATMRNDIKEIRKLKTQNHVNMKG